MTTFTIRDKEAGNIIESGLTETKAKILLEEFENQDKANGSYTPEFYEIIEETI